MENVEIYSQATIDESGQIKHTKQKKPNEILKEFQQWNDVHKTLWSSLSDGKPPENIKVQQVKNDIQWVFDKAKNIDQFGKVLIQGGECMACGKTVKFIPGPGYCSFECALKDLTNKILNHEPKGKRPYQKYLDAIQNTMNFLDMVMNIITELPQKLKDIAQVPPEYAQFLTIRINIIFLQIRIMINRLLIFKNNMIIGILKPAQLGVVDDFIAGLFPPLNQVIKVVQTLLSSVDTLMGMVINVLKMPIFNLPAGCFAWIITPRSIINIPSSPLYVNIPPSNTGNPMYTPLNNINVEAITSLIQKAFPPIAPIEYFMNPDAFDIRLALSDQGNVVKQLYEKLQAIMKFGPEYLPRYKDLKITNIWFVLAILTSWAPKAKQSFGSFINPFS